MQILVVDVGGTHVKALVSGEDPATQRRKIESGPEMTAEAMVAGIKHALGEVKFDVVALGYPGVVLRGRPISEPQNLAHGWVGFDYEQAFGCPVKIVNDAAMQALGSYEGGRLLFLGLGTGLGTAMVVDGVVEPLELAHLPYRKATFEDYVGLRGLKRLGKKRWRRRVADVVETLTHATEPTDVVLGGGNSKKLRELPPGARLGSNNNAFTGGFRLWEGGNATQPDTQPTHSTGTASPADSEPAAQAESSSPQTASDGEAPARSDDHSGEPGAVAASGES